MNLRPVQIATAVATTLCALAALGCDDAAESEVGEVSNAEVRAAKPDGTLKTHEIVPSTPTPEGLAYIRAVAAVHAKADAQPERDRIATLQRGLDLEVPAGLPEAEILRLELASRLASARLEEGEASAAKELLAPMLEPSRSVPLDRASAEALVLLGDAAAQTGDDALAAGTYARSIRMMSILRQELER